MFCSINSTVVLVKYIDVGDQKVQCELQLHFESNIQSRDEQYIIKQLQTVDEQKKLVFDCKFFSKCLIFTLILLILF